MTTSIEHTNIIEYDFVNGVGELKKRHVAFFHPFVKLRDSSGDTSL